VAKVERTLLTPTSARRRRSGGLTLSSYRGLLIVRTRPKTPKAPPSELQRAWIQRFKCYAYWSKLADPWARKIAEEMVPNTGWYWRDVIERAMSGKLLLNREEPPITTPTAYVTRSTAQNLTQNVTLYLTPDTLNWDNNYFWNPSANTTRLTVRSAGLYMIGATLLFPNGTTGRRDVILRTNGTTTIAEQGGGEGTNAGGYRSVTTIMYMRAQDYVEVGAFTSVTGQTARIFAFWIVALTPETLVP